MTTSTLIESLSSRGFMVLADGDAIKVSPASALADDERQAIRDHKAELLAFLSRQPGAECCPVCGATVEEVRASYYKHVWCPTQGHFDSWLANLGHKLKETPLFNGWR
jgi:TubC N-terminal docking domain